MSQNCIKKWDEVVILIPASIAVHFWIHQ